MDFITINTINGATWLKLEFVFGLSKFGSVRLKRVN